MEQLEGSEKKYTSEELEDWLITQISKELEIEVDDIDIELPFANYGFDSVSVVGLSGELEELLNIKLNPTIVYEFPTIQKLAGHLFQLQKGK
jgi:acyl carrier protein